MSKKPKSVWKTIHRIAKLKPKAITTFPDNLNDFSSNISKNLTGKIPKSIQKTNLQDQIDNTIERGLS